MLGILLAIPIVQELFLKYVPIAALPIPVAGTPFPESPPSRPHCLNHSSFSYIWTHSAAAAYQTLWQKGSEVRPTPTLRWPDDMIPNVREGTGKK